MSPRTSGRAGRRALIAVPAIGIPAAVVAAAVLIPTQAIGAVDLPDKSPKELIQFAQASNIDQLSGTVTQTSNLGIPDLSALSGDSGSDAPAGADLDDLLALVTGSYTAKVYLDGDRGRLQVLDTLAERNVYVDGDADAAWFVDSETKTATKLTVSGTGSHGSTPDRTLPTPEAMLDEALAALDGTTEVTVGTDGRVAGRDAYELVLTPRTDDTLVGSIRFAIDGENGSALAASITARGATDPAFSVGYTDVSFSAPDAADLTFEPGSDTTVTQKNLTMPSASDLETWRAKAQTQAPAAPTVYGQGWSSVVELAGSQGAASLPAEQRQLLDAVTTPVDDGRVFSTALVSVLITDDGRVLAGAVPADRLVEAATTGR